MDDLISRQAAIEAISYSEIAFYPGDNEGDCLRRDSDIKQAIMALPSAEPEIIRCGECTHKDKKIDYCHCLGITICERDFCSFAKRREDG